MKGEVANLIRTTNNEDEQETPSPSVEDSKDSTHSGSEDSKTMFGTGTGNFFEDPAGEKDEAQEGITQLASIRANGGTGRRASSNNTLRRASTASFKGPRGKLTDEGEKAPSQNKVQNFPSKAKSSGTCIWNTLRTAT